MTDSSYASLTAGLLARKGEALPSSGVFNGDHTGLTGPAQAAHLTPVDNDTEHVPPKNSLKGGETALKSDEGCLFDQVRAELMGRSVPKDLRAVESAKTPTITPMAKGASQAISSTPKKLKVKSAEDKERRAAVTLRLDMTRYLCLKMAAAKTGKTSQGLLTEALDSHLKSLTKTALSDCSCLKKLIEEEIV